MLKIYEVKILNVYQGCRNDFLYEKSWGPRPPAPGSDAPIDATSVNHFAEAESQMRQLHQNSEKLCFLRQIEH